jgi:hypothetical protein
MPNYLASGIFLSLLCGWLAVILTAAEILLPYLLRRSPLSTSLRIAPNPNAPYLGRMRAHYWLGYLLVAFSFAHASLLMGPALGHVNSSGLNAAMFALLLLFVQLVLGIALQTAGPNARREMTKWHFRTMLAFVLLLLAHLWLNSS